MATIHISDANYRFKSNMYLCVKSTVEDHPLAGSILTSEILGKLVIQVELKSGAETNICCEPYPKVILSIDPVKYERDGYIDEELLKRHLCHEFAHLIDRINEKFGLGLNVKPGANETRVWNVYVDGRLWRRGIEVKSFEDYEQFLFGRRISLGYDCSRAISECRKIYDADHLNYKDIVDITNTMMSELRNSHPPL